MSGRRPRVAVVVFPGSNDDRDAAVGAHRSRRRADARLARRARGCRRCDAVVLPGGFSYGDYLRCGAIARFAPAMAGGGRVRAPGRAVLGICNGFQILCEAGLLPGALRPNASLAFVCRDVGLVVERADTPFTSRCTVGQRLTIPVKHGDGCWHPVPRRRARPTSCSATRRARIRTARSTMSPASSTTGGMSWA